jgi:hypothetical protein
MPKRPLVQCANLVFSLLLLVVWGAWRANLVYATHLVVTSDILSNYTATLQEDEVLHYFTTEYYRVDPNFVEPPDLYHKPLLPFLKAKRVTEVWLTQENLHSITRLDDEDQTVVKEFIKLPTAHLYYDAIEGDVSEIRLNEQEVHSNSVLNTNIDQVSWVSGVKQSGWGRMAWIVKFQPNKLMPENFTFSTIKTASSMPQAADLAFDSVQTVWEIDQETGLLISMQQLALTADSSTIIYSMTNTLPEKLDKSELLFDLSQFITSDANALSGAAVQTATSDNSPEGSATESLMTLEQVSQQTGLPIYAPDQTLLNSFFPPFKLSTIFYNPDQSCSLQSHLSFDFEFCSGLGQNVKQEYLFASSDTYEDVEGILIAQEPLEVVSSRLRNALPRWHESHSVSLKIMDKDVEGWQASIKNGDQIVNALFFQLNDSFVQINGYGNNGTSVSLEKLIKVAESLHPMISATNNSTIFIPIIANFIATLDKALIG